MTTSTCKGFDRCYIIQPCLLLDSDTPNSVLEERLHRHHIHNNFEYTPKRLNLAQIMTTTTSPEPAVKSAVDLERALQSLPLVAEMRQRVKASNQGDEWYETRMYLRPCRWK